MTPEQFRRVDELLHAALQRPTEDRAGFIRSVEADPSVVAELLRLLNASPMPELVPPLHPTVAAPGTEPSAADGLLGVQIGPYRIRAVLGQGGMGAVYEAEHERTRQVVALKLIRPGLTTPPLLRRFEFELQVLARLEHPGIARIYHADTADIGGGPQPYFAMELVRGLNLVKYASDRKLTVRQRLELAAKIADAVQYAHQQGVIHRDLKPGNIFVTPDGQPKILDFGVARATDSDVQSTTVQTDIGQLIGTLPYMSPEQAGGDPNQVDTRSDVYALGVIVYELLTGRLPYLLEKRMIHEAIRIIKEEEPTRLSSLNRTLRGDVDTIVGKALEKAKDRRYASANALAADIRRYLNDEPITARPPSATYQFSKFARRNKGLVAGVAAAFVALTAGLIVSLVYYYRANGQAERAQLAEGRERGERIRAERALEDAKEANQLSETTQVFMRNILTGADRSEHAGRSDVTVREVLDREAAEARQRTTRTVADGAVFDVIGAIYFSLGLSNEAEYFLRRSLESYRVADPRRIEPLSNLGVILAKRGSTAEAERLHREAVELARSQSPVRELVVAQAEQNLVFSLLDSQQLEEAERLARDVLEIRSRKLPAADRSVGYAFYALGSVQLNRQQWDEAEQSLDSALKIQRGSFGVDAATTLQSLADVRIGRQQWPAAIAALRECLDLRESLLGPRHPELVPALYNLGQLLRKVGEPAEAEARLRQANEIDAANGTDLRLDTKISVRLGLGALLVDKQALDEAEPLVEGAVSAARQPGANEDQLRSALSLLARCCRAEGKLGRAESVLQEGVQLCERRFGADAPQTATWRNNLALTVQGQGRLVEAESLFRSAYEARLRALPQDHEDVANSLFSLGANLRLQTRFAESEPILRKALELDVTREGAESENASVTRLELARVCREAGDLSEAERLARESLSAFQRLQIDRRIGNACRELGAILVAKGQRPDAENVFLESARIADKLPAERLVAFRAMQAFYSAWDAAEPNQGYAAKAAEWRSRLSAIEANSRPASRSEPAASAPSP